jgi:hypothetical protein
VHFGDRAEHRVWFRASSGTTIGAQLALDATRRGRYCRPLLSPDNLLPDWQVMRQGGAYLLVLLCGCLGGCLSGDPAPSASWQQRVREGRGPLGPDGVLIGMVVIERPLGDSFLNEELWRWTDCEVAGLEKKAVLEENGFCVGQVIGINPDKLQSLLSCKRFWVGDRWQVLSAGGSTKMAISPVEPRCSFRLMTDAGPQFVELARAECVLQIEPTLTSEGRVKLKFTPSILYGDQSPSYEAGPLGWSLQYKRESKAYEAVQWEVTLAADQFLVVGTRFDEEADESAPPTLGSQFFLRDNGRMWMQRLLVVRANRGVDALGQRPEAQLPMRGDSHAEGGGQPPVVPAAMCVQSSYSP